MQMKNCLEKKNKTPSYSEKSSQYFSARLEDSFKLAPHTAVLGCVLFNIFIKDMDDRVANILTRSGRTSGWEWLYQFRGQKSNSETLWYIRELG